MQIASACLGTCVMPPLFGVLANAFSVKVMPLYLLALMTASHERLNRVS